MAKKRTTFVFDLEWHEAIRELDPEDQLEAYNAICSYAAIGEFPPTLSKSIRAMLKLIGFKIDRDKEAYQGKCESMQKARERNAKYAKRNRPIENNSATSEDEESGNEIKSTLDTAPDYGNEIKSENSEISKNGIEIKSENSEISKNGNEIKSENSEISKNGNEIKSENSEISKNGIEINGDYDCDCDCDYDSDNIKYCCCCCWDARDARVREELLKVFFDKPITTDAFKARWDTSEEELKKTCEEVFEDWVAVGEKKSTEYEARKHFMNAVRRKYEIKQEHKENLKKHEKSGKNRGSSAGRSTRRAYEEPGYGLVD